MFTPEGWGRAAHAALKATLRHMFAAGAQAIMVQETPIKTSRPPLSFGFRAAGPHRPSAVGPVRAWILTLEAWRDSPAQRRA